jgi:hypothetical protein
MRHEVHRINLMLRRQNEPHHRQNLESIRQWTVWQSDLAHQMRRHDVDLLQPQLAV